MKARCHQCRSDAEIFPNQFLFRSFREFFSELFTEYDLNEYDLTHNNMLLSTEFDSSKNFTGAFTPYRRLCICVFVFVYLVHSERLNHRNRKNLQIS